MNIRIYQVDAFTDKLFSGNPAAVCPLDDWLAEETLQKIAMENNLAETAFYVKEEGHFRIRWFTPGVEVDLCGHATLAAAHVLFNHENYTGKEITFQSRSGLLSVTHKGDFLILDFPSDALQEIGLSSELKQAFDVEPTHVFQGKTDYMLVFENEQQIKKIKPDLARISAMKVRGVIITAPGDHSDFVSRFFAPQSGVNEDPVTGSAHTSLIPYWAKRLGKNELTAFQLSPRGGRLVCTYRQDRVDIGGQARTFLTGNIHLVS